MLNEGTVQQIYKKYTYERYLNRTELLYRLQTDLLHHKSELWSAIVNKRKQSGRVLPLKDQNGQPFWYMIPPFLEQIIHDIDFSAKKRIDQLMIDNVRNDLIAESTMDEAYFSSTIEGAFSTKKRTRELVQNNDPVNKSEKMILNNYRGLTYILEHLHDDLTEDIFILLHKVITEDTLDPDEVSERYRDNDVYVWDSNAAKTEPIFTAPKAENIQPMMDELFSFIHNQDAANYIHPVIKSMIIHFYIVYAHPFFDGNGRVARAFSYMYLLKQGYDFFKFFSISSIVSQHRGRYYRAIKDTEDFDNDMTYFISTYAQMTLQSIEETIHQLVRETDFDVLLSQLRKDGVLLSDRQKKFLRYMSKKENNLTTVKDYQKRSHVAYETARKDLSELTELGIFKKAKKAKKFIYTYLGIKGYQAI